MQFEVIEQIPSNEVLQEIFLLEKQCFPNPKNTPDKLLQKFKQHKNILILLAKYNNKYIAYKIGYENKKYEFYSWLGGVSPNYRNKQIARKLMELQHQILKEKNYKFIKTQTYNQFKNMLALNLKCGFEIIGTELNSQKSLKITLEKKL